LANQRWDTSRALDFDTEIHIHDNVWFFRRSRNISKKSIGSSVAQNFKTYIGRFTLYKATFQNIFFNKKSVKEVLIIIIKAASF